MSHPSRVDLPFQDPPARRQAPDHPSQARPSAAAGAVDGVPALTVTVIDGFHMWAGTHQVRPMPQGKLGSLLKLFVLQRRRPIARTRLCALFWPEAEANAARNNLNGSLHRLRRLLGDAAQLKFEDDAYQLVVEGPASIDSEAFEALAELGALEEGCGRLGAAIDAYDAAAQLYQTDLVSDIDADLALGPCAQALRDRLNQVLSRLADLREASGDLHGCLRTALRNLALDECNEAAHRQLMRCYARLDQPGEVERQYRRCVGVLRLQLGLGPSEETRRCYHGLCQRPVAEAPAEGPSPPAQCCNGGGTAS